ncbi:unnamed protein product, partial [Iphiclides podalirius]
MTEEEQLPRKSLEMKIQSTEYFSPMDKPWGNRGERGGAPWSDEYGAEEPKGLWRGASTTAAVEELSPQARMAVERWSDSGNAWSAALGAAAGAGTILLLAAILLLWRRPRRTEPPTLAPMDVGQNLLTS